MNLSDKSLSIETGKLAKQANGAVLVRLGDTMILVAAAASKKPREGLNFFPLTVEYREKAYAAGKIPGGFFKREGKPSDKEVLSSRIIDRTIRPMFPDEFSNEVQVIANVLSSDKENDPDVLGILGASIALSISDIPFFTPIAAVRVGRISDQLIINPTYSEIEESDIEFIIAGSKDSITMVEGEAREISEDDMIDVLQFGHDVIKELISFQEEFISKCAKPKMEIIALEVNNELIEEVKKSISGKVEEIVNIQEKGERSNALGELINKIEENLEEKYPECRKTVAAVISDVEKTLVRNMVLTEQRRLDGRKPDEIRPIETEVGLLPRVHGSALFTRGQTQALAATTLGTKIDEQKMDGLDGEFYKSYMLHYNFPPFCVGEVRPMRGTSRREVGHGNLAERALKFVIPNDQIFPYTIRIVSDVLESNGSSSMATVCAGSLALMDTGVPIKASVAGIAMGLIKSKENDDYEVLTDILGDEDHLGDMDFKVAGTEQGITAFQMDIKLKELPFDILKNALEKARSGRLHILSIMDKTIDKPRSEISSYAPRIITLKVNADVIGMIIGPGGKTIRDIIERTEAAIDINDDGTVTIASVEAEKGEHARRIIEELIKEPEVGEIYKGKVKKIMNFGAFVEILPGKEGLLHISAIENHRINNVEDVLKVGDEVEVKLMKIDHGKYELNRKILLNKDK